MKVYAGGQILATSGGQMIRASETNRSIVTLTAMLVVEAE